MRLEKLIKNRIHNLKEKKQKQKSYYDQDSSFYLIY